MDDLTVVSCTLSQLLDSANQPLPGTDIQAPLVIPEYQRPYVWGQKQVDQLLKDLLEHSEIIADKPLFYLGSIVLHHTGEQLKLIDGQQRIATSILFQKAGGKPIHSDMQFSSPESIANLKRNLSYLVALRDNEIFEFQDKEVFGALDYDHINVTLVITRTEDMAYTFFETQNTGGVRLSGSDILKAHHLRAIPDAKIVNYQARRWESVKSDEVEFIIQQLAKIRFWDNRQWRKFPFYRNKKEIKTAIIDEFTVNTKSSNEDISYHYSAVKKEGGRLLHVHESTFKMIKQPLSNGSNTLDYVNDYVRLYSLLFKNNDDHRIEDRFYAFRNQVLHGLNGTLFLCELLKVCLLAYVSRFGFHRLVEATFWLYRMTYAMRVATVRNVREDMVFKFVHDHQLIDNILEVFTPDELFTYLKRYRYQFNPENADPGKTKGKHIETLRNYFNQQGAVRVQGVECYRDEPGRFDRDLVTAISGML